MDYTKWAKETFGNDIYATNTTGIEIIEANINYAVCKLEINKSHLNAANNVMGGAIYTLADFTFAIAANAGKSTTVSLCGNINYVNAPKGNLTAIAKCIKDGRRTCVFEVVIRDKRDEIVATVVMTGMRV